MSGEFDFLDDFIYEISGKPAETQFSACESKKYVESTKKSSIKSELEETLRKDNAKLRSRLRAYSKSLNEQGTRLTQLLTEKLSMREEQEKIQDCKKKLEEANLYIQATDQLNKQLHELAKTYANEKQELNKKIVTLQRKVRKLKKEINGAHQRDIQEKKRKLKQLRILVELAEILLAVGLLPVKYKRVLDGWKFEVSQNEEDDEEGDNNVEEAAEKEEEHAESSSAAQVVKANRPQMQFSKSVSSDPRGKAPVDMMSDSESEFSGEEGYKTSSPPSKNPPHTVPIVDNVRASSKCLVNSTDEMLRAGRDLGSTATSSYSTLSNGNQLGAGSSSVGSKKSSVSRIISPLLSNESSFPSNEVNETDKVGDLLLEEENWHLNDDESNGGSVSDVELEVNRTIERVRSNTDSGKQEQREESLHPTEKYHGLGKYVELCAIFKEMCYKPPLLLQPLPGMDLVPHSHKDLCPNDQVGKESSEKLVEGVAISIKSVSHTADKRVSAVPAPSCTGGNSSSQAPSNILLCDRFKKGTKSIKDTSAEGGQAGVNVAADHTDNKSSSGVSLTKHHGECEIRDDDGATKKIAAGDLNDVSASNHETCSDLKISQKENIRKSSEVLGDLSPEISTGSNAGLEKGSSSLKSSSAIVEGGSSSILGEKSVECQGGKSLEISLEENSNGKKDARKGRGRHGNKRQKEGEATEKESSVKEGQENMVTSKASPHTILTPLNEECQRRFSLRPRKKTPGVESTGHSVVNNSVQVPREVDGECPIDSHSGKDTTISEAKKGIRDLRSTRKIVDYSDNSDSCDSMVHVNLALERTVRSEQLKIADKNTREVAVGSQEYSQRSQMRESNEAGSGVITKPDNDNQQINIPNKYEPKGDIPCIMEKSVCSANSNEKLNPIQVYNDLRSQSCQVLRSAIDKKSGQIVTNDSTTGVEDVGSLPSIENCTSSMDSLECTSAEDCELSIPESLSSSSTNDDSGSVASPEEVDVNSCHSQEDQGSEESEIESDFTPVNSIDCSEGLPYSGDTPSPSNSSFSLSSDGSSGEYSDALSVLDKSEGNMVEFPNMLEQNDADKKEVGEFRRDAKKNVSGAPMLKDCIPSMGVSKSTESTELGNNYSSPSAKSQMGYKSMQKSHDLNKLTGTEYPKKCTSYEIYDKELFLEDQHVHVPATNVSYPVVEELTKLVSSKGVDPPKIQQPIVKLSAEPSQKLSSDICLSEDHHALPGADGIQLIQVEKEKRVESPVLCQSSCKSQVIQAENSGKKSVEKKHLKDLEIFSERTVSMDDSYVKNSQPPFKDPPAKHSLGGSFSAKLLTSVPEKSRNFVGLTQPGKDISVIGRNAPSKEVKYRQTVPLLFGKLNLFRFPGVKFRISGCFASEFYPEPYLVPKFPLMSFGHGDFHELYQLLKEKNAAKQPKALVPLEVKFYKRGTFAPPNFTDLYLNPKRLSINMGHRRGKVNFIHKGGNNSPSLSDCVPVCGHLEEDAFKDNSCISAPGLCYKENSEISSKDSCSTLGDDQESSCESMISVYDQVNVAVSSDVISNVFMAKVHGPENAPSHETKTTEQNDQICHEKQFSALKLGRADSSVGLGDSLNNSGELSTKILMQEDSKRQKNSNLSNLTSQPVGIRPRGLGYMEENYRSIVQSANQDKRDSDESRLKVKDKAESGTWKNSLMNPCSEKPHVEVVTRGKDESSLTHDLEIVEPISRNEGNGGKLVEGKNMKQISDGDMAGDEGIDDIIMTSNPGDSMADMGLKPDGSSESIMLDSDDSNLLQTRIPLDLPALPAKEGEEKEALMDVFVSESVNKIGQISKEKTREELKANSLVDLKIGANVFQTLFSNESTYVTMPRPANSKPASLGVTAVAANEILEAASIMRASNVLPIDKCLQVENLGSLIEKAGGLQAFSGAEAIEAAESMSEEKSVNNLPMKTKTICKTVDVNVTDVSTHNNTIESTSSSESMQGSTSLSMEEERNEMKSFSVGSQGESTKDFSSEKRVGDSSCSPRNSNIQSTVEFTEEQSVHKVSDECLDNNTEECVSSSGSVSITKRAIAKEASEKSLFGTDLSDSSLPSEPVVDPVPVSRQQKKRRTKIASSSGSENECGERRKGNEEQPPPGKRLKHGRKQRKSFASKCDAIFGSLSPNGSVDSVRSPDGGISQSPRRKADLPPSPFYSRDVAENTDEEGEPLTKSQRARPSTARLNKKYGGKEDIVCEGIEQNGSSDECVANLPKVSTTVAKRGSSSAKKISLKSRSNWRCNKVESKPSEEKDHLRSVSEGAVSVSKLSPNASKTKSKAESISKIVHSSESDGEGETMSVEGGRCNKQVVHVAHASKASPKLTKDRSSLVIGEVSEDEVKSSKGEGKKEMANPEATEMIVDLNDTTMNSGKPINKNSEEESTNLSTEPLISLPLKERTGNISQATECSNSITHTILKDYSSDEKVVPEYNKEEILHEENGTTYSFKKHNIFTPKLVPIGNEFVGNIKKLNSFIEQDALKQVCFTTVPSFNFKGAHLSRSCSSALGDGVNISEEIKPRDLGEKYVRDQGLSSIDKSSGDVKQVGASVTLSSNIFTQEDTKELENSTLCNLTSQEIRPKGLGNKGENCRSIVQSANQDERDSDEFRLKVKDKAESGTWKNSLMSPCSEKPHVEVVTGNKDEGSLADDLEIIEPISRNEGSGGKLVEAKNMEQISDGDMAGDEEIDNVIMTINPGDSIADMGLKPDGSSESIMLDSDDSNLLQIDLSSDLSTHPFKKAEEKSLMDLFASERVNKVGQISEDKTQEDLKANSLVDLKIGANVFQTLFSNESASVTRPGNCSSSLVVSTEVDTNEFPESALNERASEAIHIDKCLMAENLDALIELAGGLQAFLGTEAIEAAESMSEEKSLNNLPIKTKTNCKTVDVNVTDVSTHNNTIECTSSSESMQGSTSLSMEEERNGMKSFSVGSKGESTKDFSSEKRVGDSSCSPRNSNIQSSVEFTEEQSVHKVSDECLDNNTEECVSSSGSVSITKRAIAKEASEKSLFGTDLSDSSLPSEPVVDPVPVSRRRKKRRTKIASSSESEDECGERRKENEEQPPPGKRLKLGRKKRKSFASKCDAIFGSLSPNGSVDSVRSPDGGISQSPRRKADLPPSPSCGRDVAENTDEEGEPDDGLQSSMDESSAGPSSTNCKLNTTVAEDVVIDNDSKSNVDAPMPSLKGGHNKNSHVPIAAAPSLCKGLSRIGKFSLKTYASKKSKALKSQSPIVKLIPKNIEVKDINVADKFCDIRLIQIDNGLGTNSVTSFPEVDKTFSLSTKKEERVSIENATKETESTSQISSAASPSGQRKNRKQSFIGSIRCDDAIFIEEGDIGSSSAKKSSLKSRSNWRCNKVESKPSKEKDHLRSVSEGVVSVSKLSPKASKTKSKAKSSSKIVHSSESDGEGETSLEGGRCNTKVVHVSHASKASPKLTKDRSSLVIGEVSEDKVKSSKGEGKKEMANPEATEMIVDLNDTTMNSGKPVNKNSEEESTNLSTEPLISLPLKKRIANLPQATECLNSITRTILKDYLSPEGTVATAKDKKEEILHEEGGYKPPFKKRIATAPKLVAPLRVLKTQAPVNSSSSNMSLVKNENNTILSYDQEYVPPTKKRTAHIPKGLTKIDNSFPQTESVLNGNSSGMRDIKGTLPITEQHCNQSTKKRVGHPPKSLSTSTNAEHFKSSFTKPRGGSCSQKKLLHGGESDQRKICGSGIGKIRRSPRKKTQEFMPFPKKRYLPTDSFSESFQPNTFEEGDLHKGDALDSVTAIDVGVDRSKSPEKEAPNGDKPDFLKKPMETLLENTSQKDKMNDSLSVGVVQENLLEEMEAPPLSPLSDDVLVDSLIIFPDSSSEEDIKSIDFDTAQEPSIKRDLRKEITAENPHEINELPITKDISTSLDVTMEESMDVVDVNKVEASMEGVDHQGDKGRKSKYSKQFPKENASLSQGLGPWIGSEAFSRVGYEANVNDFGLAFPSQTDAVNKQSQSHPPDSGKVSPSTLISVLEGITNDWRKNKDYFNKMLKQVQLENGEKEKSKNVPSRLSVNLRKILKAQLGRLNEKYFGNSILNSIIAVISDDSNGFKSKNVAKYLVQMLSKEDEDDVQPAAIPGAPRMTRLQMRVLSLVLALENRCPRFSDLSEVMLDGMSYILFRLGRCPDVEVVKTLARMYTVICMAKNDIMRARCFCFDALFSIASKAVELITVVICMWHEVLPVQDSSRVPSYIESSVFMAISHVAASKNSVVQKNISALKRIVCNIYKAEFNKITFDQFLDKLMLNLSDGGNLQGLEPAAVLMAKRQGWEWTHKNLLCGRLVSIMENWKQDIPSTSSAVTAVNLIGLTSRSCPIETSGPVKNIIETLSRTLIKEPCDDPSIKEALVVALIRLSKYHMYHIVRALDVWRPMREPSDEVKNAIRGLILRPSNQKFFKVKYRSWKTPMGNQNKKGVYFESSKSLDANEISAGGNEGENEDYFESIGEEKKAGSKVESGKCWLPNKNRLKYKVWVKEENNEEWVNSEVKNWDGIAFKQSNRRKRKKLNNT